MTAPTPHPSGSEAPASNGVNPARTNRASTSADYADSGEANASSTAESAAPMGASTAMPGESTGAASPDAPGAASGARPGGAKASPLDGLENQFSELLAYVAHYVTAQRDLVQWRLLAVFWRVVLLLGVGLAVLSVLVTAAVFVLLGLAHGLGAALGDRMWAGELIVGLAVFIVLAISQSVAFKRLRRRWRERIMVKYEYYRQRERAAFGRDVAGAAERRVD